MFGCGGLVLVLLFVSSTNLHCTTTVVVVIDCMMAIASLLSHWYARIFMLMLMHLCLFMSMLLLLLLL